MLGQKLLARVPRVDSKNLKLQTGFCRQDSHVHEGFVRLCRQDNRAHEDFVDRIFMYMGILKGFCRQDFHVHEDSVDEDFCAYAIMIQ